MSGEQTPAALASLEPDYEIIREIGRGGTAVVYLARERATGDEVAIKLIRAKYLEDEEAMARFAREARFVAQLDHPNIVGVHAVLDLGAAGIALVMAHVEGRTLKQLIQEERPLRINRVVPILRDVAEALAAAHARGIIHRDVKPENIFIDVDGRALLADFGVARSMSGDTQLTMSGVAIGTPSYMAPEQIDGGELDGRGDIYSLGLVAWEMFTGHRPWEGESLYAVLYHQRHHELPDVREMRQDVTDELADVINGAIEKEPSARWQSMNEFIAALDGVAPSRRAKDHVPVSTETVRFARPLTPAPDTPVVAIAPVRRELVERLEEDDRTVPVQSDLAPAAGIAGAALATSQIASYFAPGELDEIPPQRRVPFSRKQVGLAAAALIALISLGLVVTAVRDRADTTSAAAARSTRTASAGDIARPESRSRVAADSTRAAMALPESLSVAAAIASSPTNNRAVAQSGSGTPDAPVAITLGPTRGGSAAKPNAPPPRSAAQIPAPVPPAPQPSMSIAEAIGPAPTARTRVSIVAGGLHTCLVTSEGRAYCWGGNDRGQVGGTTEARTASPTSVGAELRFTAIAPGLAHSCAIARGGGLWCWGENDHGQLGDRTTIARPSPVRAAVGHAFRAIASGAAHSCGLDLEGEAWCWGSNARGQLGDGGALDRSAPVAVATDSRFASLDVGWNFTCAVTVGGIAMCWGENAFGQLGDGSTSDRHAPVPVRGDIAFRSVTAGNAHACGVTSSGEAYCWGRNASGELGEGTTSPRSTPVRVKSDEHFVSIAAGAVHTCAVAEDGEAWCWGRNTYGQLGNGGTSDSSQPTRVSGGHIFTSVRAFGSHTCGSTVSGEAFCWGYNSDGQLGDGTRTSRTRPVYVERPSG